MATEYFTGDSQTPIKVVDYFADATVKEPASSEAEQEASSSAEVAKDDATEAEAETSENGAGQDT